MVHTAKAMIPAVGQRVSVSMESLTVTCEVLDCKSSYGRVRLLVAPLAGSGSQYVEMSRVSAATDTVSHNNFAARLEDAL